MAKNNNLTDFLTDLANTIRTKKGYASTTKLNPQDFSSEISSITTVKNQTKTGINPSTSSQTITFDSGYTGLSSVQINAMTTMTLPTSATTTKPSGTTKATFSRSTSTRYLVIPAGYNSTAAYYTISAVANGSATGRNGTVSQRTAADGFNTSTGVVTVGYSVGNSTPSISAGYISSGIAGGAYNGTLTYTLSKANAQAYVGSGSAKGNAGTLTYKSHTQDSTNKKKFTITATVSAPAPTVSAGYISSGTAGTASDKTVSITITDAQAQAAVGTAVFTNSTTSKYTTLTTVTPGASAKYAYPSTAGYVPTTSAVKINGDSNLVPANIKNGVTIFGVTGTLSGAGGKYYVQSSKPTSSFGSDGDICIVV